MNLSYRGIAYQSTTPAVEAIETEQIGHFLGKSYKVRQSTVAHRHNPSNLTYRGVSYS